jgi:Flp pilus assembly protein TadB
MKPLSHVVQFLFVVSLSILLTIPQNAWAQNHVVSPSDIQKDVAAASTSREKQVAQLESFFSSPQAQRAMKSVHITYQQVDNAVQQLSSDDLARLSARSETAQKDFAAGNISNRDLLIIILGILALTLIIVAVR